MTPDDLKSHLETLNWNQADFARRIGVSSNTVYRWAAGIVPLPGWIAGYLDMAVTVHRCVTGQASLSIEGVPLSIYELADRIGIDYDPQFKARQQAFEQSMGRKLRQEWSHE